MSLRLSRASLSLKLCKQKVNKGRRCSGGHLSCSLLSTCNLSTKAAMRVLSVRAAAWAAMTLSWDCFLSRKYRDSRLRSRATLRWSDSSFCLGVRERAVGIVKKHYVVNNDLLLSSDVGTRIDEFALPAVNSVVQVRKSVGDL